MILSFLILNVQRLAKTWYPVYIILYIYIYVDIYIYIKKAIDYIINFNNFMTI